MGQKVHPVGIRLGIVKEHTSVWYADGRNYADYLNTDLKVRAYIQDKLKAPLSAALIFSVRLRQPASPFTLLVRAS